MNHIETHTTREVAVDALSNCFRHVKWINGAKTRKWAKKARKRENKENNSVYGDVKEL